jgi:hypothetical protein
MFGGSWGMLLGGDENKVVSKRFLFETLDTVTINFLQQGYTVVSKLCLKIYVSILDK